MKTKLIILLGLVPMLALAQTNTPPPVLGTNSQTEVELLGNGLFNVAKTIYGAMPTNLAIGPYATYVVQPKKIGYGTFVAYNISLGGGVQAGPVVLIDHVDQFLAFSGGVTLQKDMHPLQWFGYTNSTFTVTPFVISAVGTSLAGAGSANGSAQTLLSSGADIKFGHLWGGQFLVGGAYGTRTGAGAYKGAYLNGFAGWKKNGFKIGLMLN